MTILILSLTNDNLQRLVFPRDRDAVTVEIRVITAPMNYNENKKLFCGVYPQVLYFAIFWKLQNNFKNKAQ